MFIIDEDTKSVLGIRFERSNVHSRVKAYRVRVFIIGVIKKNANELLRT